MRKTVVSRGPVRGVLGGAWSGDAAQAVGVAQVGAVSGESIQGKGRIHCLEPGGLVLAGEKPLGKASRKQSSLSGKESAQGCLPKRGFFFLFPFVIL